MKTIKSSGALKCAAAAKLVMNGECDIKTAADNFCVKIANVARALAREGYFLDNKIKLTESDLINFDIPDGIPAKAIKKGQLVKRKADANTVYVLGSYCRYEKKYELQDYYDINRFVYVKKDKNLFLNFEF
jgi:hypothetical protein